MSSNDKTGSANANVDALQGQQQSGASGEFHSKVGRDEPMQTSGVCLPPRTLSRQPVLTVRQHKPGLNVGNDAVPEFSAETLPAGTAPKSSTFKPNPVDSVPPTQQSRDNSSIEGDAEQASALDFPGARPQAP